MLAFEVLVWLTILCEVLKYGDSETCSSSVYRYRNPTKERPHLKEHPPTTFGAWMSIFLHCSWPHNQQQSLTKSFICTTLQALQHCVQVL